MRNELPYRTQTYIYIHLMEYIQAKIVGHDDACHEGCLCVPLVWVREEREASHPAGRQGVGVMEGVPSATVCEQECITL